MNDDMSLALVQKHVVEFLAQLDRPPRTLRVQLGEALVDISWESLPVPASGNPVAVAEPVDEADGAAVADCLTSPGVGVFYHAPEPGADPFVSVGSLVRPGQQIGIIEAMKLMIPVEADRIGRIAAVLKGNGEPVEYAEPLFALDAADS